MTEERMTVFPFRPSDWVSDAHGRVAKVKGVWEGKPGEVLLDLVLYSRTGERVGRESPPMGGPRSFEPACACDGWHRIEEPSFPIALKWVSAKDGRKRAQYFAGDPLPPANWKKSMRRSRAIRLVADDKMRRALKQIADGHNDPRRLAADVLKQTTS